MYLLSYFVEYRGLLIYNDEVCILLINLLNRNRGGNLNNKKTLLRIITSAMVAALIIINIPTFDIKVQAQSNTSKSIEDNLKQIVSKYGEENMIFDDGIYLTVGEEINVSELYSDGNLEWKSENEEIVNINNGIITGKGEGTTFILAKKDSKYIIKEVYVSSEENNISLLSTVESRDARSQYVAYIDPGHGGYDPGTSGNGIIEKDLVLKIALSVKSKLEAKGIKVIMSRTTDTYVSLEDRSKGANQANPDIFISIHVNSAGAVSASGIETYYYKGIDKDLAESLQSKLISYTGAKDRGAKFENFHVVRETKMPSSLVEIGFLTNVNEANNMKSSSYQEKLSNAIVDGAVDYLNDMNPITASRIYGMNRYETSYEILKNGWNTSEYVVFASGLDYPDALCATPLATKYNAPILLLENRSLKAQTELVELLKNRNVKQAFIVGGTGVISSSIEKELSEMGITSERLGGKDRYETSVAIAEEVGNTTGQVALAYGLGFADGLSIASIAGMKNMPILLTNTKELPSVVNNYIKNSNISKTFIIGANGVISDSIASKLPNAERLGGRDRYETNKNVFDRFKSELNLNELYIASALDFPDALSVSALAGKNSNFVLLSNLKVAESSSKSIISSSKVNLKNVYVLGSNKMITDNVLYDLGVNLIK